jgi:hypothetical protein
MTGLAEYMPALRFHDQLFEDLFGLCIDLQNALPGPPLQSALDDQVSPVAVLIGTLADEYTIFFKIQHFDPLDPRVAPVSLVTFDFTIVAEPMLLGQREKNMGTIEHHGTETMCKGLQSAAVSLARVCQKIGIVGGC